MTKEFRTRARITPSIFRLRCIHTCSVIIYPFIPVVLSSVSTTYLLLVELNSLRTCTNAARTNARLDAVHTNQAVRIDVYSLLSENPSL